MKKIIFVGFYEEQLEELIKMLSEGEMRTYLEEVLENAHKPS